MTYPSVLDNVVYEENPAERVPHLDCELYLSGQHQGLLSAEGREYFGHPQLDETLRDKLLPLELDAEAYGTALFHGLFPGDGDELLIGYRESLSLARQGRQPMRLRLHLAACARRLHDLRWELLYDPYRRIFLARSGEVALSRYLSVSSDPPRGVVERPRLLVAVACPQDLEDYGLPPLDRQAIEANLEHALAPLKRAWHVDYLRGPVSAGNLRAHMSSVGYHAVHLLAHGRLSNRLETASLALQETCGSTEWVDERMLAETFGDNRNLRLLSLIACNGAQTAANETFSGLAPILVRRGIPAVVAMGRRITLSAATDFSRHFYGHLARGQAIDAAVNEARLQLHLAAPNSLEWSVPTLFMRLRRGELWQPPRPKNKVFILPTIEQWLQKEELAKNHSSEIQERSSDSIPLSEPERTKTEIKTLLVSDMVASTQLAEELGDQRMADIWRRHDRLARDLLYQHRGCEANRTDGFLMLFDRPLDAVRFALDFHEAMAALSREENVELQFRVGIHLGEVVLMETPAEDVARGAKPMDVEGLAKPVAARLMSLAGGQQIILSRAAFDLARRSAVGSGDLEKNLRWVAHGDYLLKGVTQPMGVYEVGAEGSASFNPPADGDKVKRVPEDGTILGWRPALGQKIPMRSCWFLESKLGEGGFGEVWLAKHTKTAECRVFKFCFEVEHLKALRCEITLFRLLKETLGDRQDIARILDWRFDEQPFYIEAEYTSGGNLFEWAEEQGGIDKVPLTHRLEIVAQIGDALAAAHSVGVLHKDVKPANILIQTLPGGRPRARLTDFGIGGLSDTSHLLASGITVLDLTELSRDGDLTRSGTLLYTAPEVIEGHPSSVQADIYALGVVLYQLLVGSFFTTLSPGWEREIDDPLLQRIVAQACDGHPQKRVADSSWLAHRLRTLDERRAAIREEEEARLEEEQVWAALLKAQKRRRQAVRAVALLGIATLVLGTMAGLFLQQRWLAEESAHAATVAKSQTQDAQNFLVNMFALGNPQQTPVYSMTVKDFLKLGEAQLTEGPGDPRTRARLQTTLAHAYLNLGLLGEAQNLLESALQTQENLLAEGTLDPQDEDIDQTLTTLASVAYYEGDYALAKERFQTLLTQQEDRWGPEDPRLAGPLNNLAAVHDLLGESAKAYGLFRRMLEIDRAHLEPDDLELAKGLSNFGLYLNDRGQYDAAEAYHREAIEIADENPQNHLALPNFLDGLAAAHFHRGRYDEALPLAQRALAIRLEAFGPESIKVANSYDLVAQIYRDWPVGGDIAEAERLFLAAHKIWRASEAGRNHQFFGMSLRELARLYIQQRREGMAEPLLRRSVEILQSALGEDHLETLASKELLLSLSEA